MGITATIQNIPGGKKVILIAVSVGTEYYKPESFDALVDALLENVGKGVISPDTPCVVLRGCLVQRHTLEFKHDLTPEQALSLAIHNGDEWQKDCHSSLLKLKSTFKNFELIRWGDELSSENKKIQEKTVIQENSNIYYQNQYFIIKQLEGTVEYLEKKLPKYELQLTEKYKNLLEKFNLILSDPKHGDIAGFVEAAVDSYCNSYVSSKMKNNMDMVIMPTQLEKIKAQSRKYVPEDVLILNQTIELMLEKHKPLNSTDEDFSICFTYPFPHGNVTENATMHVLTNKKLMKPDVKYHLVFPKLFINHGYPVPSAEERERAKKEKHARREEIKARAAIKAGRLDPEEPTPAGLIEPKSGGSSSPSSSGTTSPKTPRSSPSTPSDTSPVGSPKKESKLEQVTTILEIQNSDVKSTVGDSAKCMNIALKPIEKSATQVGSAPKNVSQNGSNIPANIGSYSTLFLLSANKGANNSAQSLNDTQLLQIMTDLAQKSVTALEVFSMTFPGCDKKMLEKMALLFTVQQQAAISASTLLPLQRSEEAPLSEPPLSAPSQSLTPQS